MTSEMRGFYSRLMADKFSFDHSEYSLSPENYLDLNLEVMATCSTTPIWAQAVKICLWLNRSILVE